MDTPPDKRPVPLLSNPLGVEMFADEVAGIFTRAGIVRISFESLRANHDAEKSGTRVIVGRVVLPLEGAARLRDLLVQHLVPGSVPPPPVQ